MPLGVNFGDLSHMANPSALVLRTLSWLEKLQSGARYTPSILLASRVSSRLIVDGPVVCPWLTRVKVGCWSQHGGKLLLESTKFQDMPSGK